MPKGTFAFILPVSRVTGTPEHPIVLPPDEGGGGTPEHPIVLPGHPEHPIALPGHPEHPIALPGHPEHPIALPGFPSHPIVLPGLPEHPIVIPPPSLPPGTAGSMKPEGLPILPNDGSMTPPTGPPQLPGNWVTVNAGRGEPPAWAFIPQDTGLAINPLATAAGATAGGHWVAIGTPTPKDARPHETVWAWVPEIGPGYGTGKPNQRNPTK